MLLLVVVGLSAFHVVGARPPDLVLLLLSDQPDTLQHVRDVVDAPLLHRQLPHRVIQVHALFRGFFNELDKLFGELDKSVVLAGPFPDLAIGKAAASLCLLAGGLDIEYKVAAHNRHRVTQLADIILHWFYLKLSCDSGGATDS